MDDVKRAIFVALITTVAAGIIIVKNDILWGKRAHHLKSGMLVLS